MAYDKWSIGIYSGDSPFRLAPDPITLNPVLTAADVTDVPAQFVADPFMICIDAVWYMFFEVFNRRNGKGEIGFAVSHDRIEWTYQCIVVAEPFHLSYPYLVRFENELLLIPECYRGGGARAYRAINFPFTWQYAGQFTDARCADSCVFQYRKLFWMFWCDPNGRHDTLRLGFARELFGNWTEHPLSPVVAGNPGIARPAGKILLNGEPIVRFAQDCSTSYGHSVRAFEITSLTETDYSEREHIRSPILAGSGSGWNAAQMHHIDAHQISNQHWIACVDGLAET